MFSRYVNQIYSLKDVGLMTERDIKNVRNRGVRGQREQEKEDKG